METKTSPPAPRVSWPIAAFVAIALVTVVLGYYRMQPAANDAKPLNLKPGGTVGQVSTPFITPGIRQPPVLKVADAKLDDETEVIGVAVEGHPRAYVVKAFCSTMSHVVNDLLGDIPVSVTYYDLCKTAKVFTDPRRGSPLEIKLGGFMDGGMLLYTGSFFYRQDTLQPSFADNPTPFPHAQLPFETTTWKQWRTRYPDTEVYVSAPVAAAQ